MIEVRLFATFREGREKIYFLEPEEFHKPSEVLKHLNISPEEVAICLINGMHSRLTKPIKDGDVIALFPPVGGG